MLFFLYIVIKWLAAPIGNIGQIQCSDWLPEWAGSAHLSCIGLPTLILRKKKSA